MTDPISRRHVLGMVAGSASAVFIAGCTREPAPPGVDRGPALAQPTPALKQDRFDIILTEFQEELAAADEARDAALLNSRVSGSAAEFRAATYALIEKYPAHESELTRPSAEATVWIAATSEYFPRHALAFVQDEDPSRLPFFVGFTQASPRAQYTSWGWARQAALVDMPSVPGAATGAQEVAIDANDLLLTPQAALEMYAGLLSHGHHNADPDDLISEDPFQQKVHEDIQTERRRINDGVELDQVATVHERYSVKEGEYLGLRTADGGAIVMATLLSTRRLDVRSGAINYSAPNIVTELTGTMEFRKEVVRTWGTTVLLHIPTKDSGSKIQPIGAFKVLLGVSGS